jgi:hypothetical protein
VGCQYDRIGIAMPSGQNALIQLWNEQARYCHWWFPYDGVVLASDRPRTLAVDERGRLHNAEGAALQYSDGYSVYAWHGVRVEPRLITDPASISVDEIEQHSNAEIRRVMIERYGWTRYIADCGAEVVDRGADDHPVAGLRGARLLRKELPDAREAIIYLAMRNSSPERDGSTKEYLLRIDPRAYNGEASVRCWAAMASLWKHRDDQGELRPTFDDWRDYRPTLES